MIDGFSQPLALILFPSTRMPGGTLISTGGDRPVGECLAALFLLTTGSPLALMLSLLAQLRKYCHVKLGGCTLQQPRCISDKISHKKNNKISLKL